MYRRFSTVRGNAVCLKKETAAIYTYKWVLLVREIEDETRSRKSSCSLVYLAYGDKTKDGLRGERGTKDTVISENDVTLDKRNE